MKFEVVIEPTGNGYSAYVPDLPGCIAAADTREDTKALIHEAIAFHMEALRDHEVPDPGAEPGLAAAPATSP